ncbi:FecCD family ABC transporter permease [Gracilibacillus phocaeensis]|uniref:FecCD family ABC transporter permease n=1 Tax=Gracilibacillus phocaeensis TaxID=2042304 RepID=UPI00256FDD5B|nr:iron chelate uptake ABC transporter family permease subunit [Gracilibacillus phocaeensis]
MKNLQSVKHKMNWKAYIVILTLVILLFLLSLSTGSTLIPIQELWQHITRQSDQHVFTINILRMPRALLALLVGAALGTAGLILQSIIRNPLASPDIIGITSGGSFGALFFIVFLLDMFSIQWLPLAAIIGAALVATLVYLLSWKNGVTPTRLVLIGIGIAAGMSALVTFMVVFSETAVTTKAYLWLTGSLYGAAMTEVWQMSIWFSSLFIVVLLLAKTMEVLELGDELATSLGVRVQLLRCALLFTSVGLAGAAVAFAGGIGFIGLIAPHIAKKIVPYSLLHLLPITAMIGGFMLMSADLIGRIAFMPLDIPAGVFTASIGAPFFIYLLYRNRYI